jgi:peptidoglycan/xylan/chitin deacetylase (PgdA/CDA1 family)
LRGDVLVVAYHRVARDARSPLDVGLGQLERHVRALRRRGYRFETVTPAVSSAGGNERIAAITFDDGDPSVAELALPLLTSLDVPGTAFVSTAEERRLDLRPLLAAGWEIGSHGHRHVALTSLAATELERELRESREAIAAECEGCTSIAYPYSAVDNLVVDAARGAGFAVGCTPATTPALGPLAWPRVGIGADDGDLAFAAKTSRVGRRLRRSSIGAALAAAARSSRRSTQGLRHR